MILQTVAALLDQVKLLFLIGGVIMYDQEAAGFQKSLPFHQSLFKSHNEDGALGPDYIKGISREIHLPDREVPSLASLPR